RAGAQASAPPVTISKSPGLAPSRVGVIIPVMAPPVLVTVKVVASLMDMTTVWGKAKGLGEMVSAPGSVPVPLRADITDSVPAATISDAVLGPADVGAKLTATVQVALAASAPVQVVVPMVNWDES